MSQSINTCDEIETWFVSAFVWKVLDDIKTVPVGSLVIQGGKRFRYQQNPSEEGGHLVSMRGGCVFSDEPVDIESTNYWSVAPPINPDLESPAPMHSCVICARDTVHCVYLPNTSSCSKIQLPFYPACNRDPCLRALDTMLSQSEHHHLLSFNHNVEWLVVRHGQKSGKILFGSVSISSAGVPQLCVGGIWVDLDILKKQNEHLAEKFEFTLAYPYIHHYLISILVSSMRSELLTKQQWAAVAKEIYDTPVPLASVYPYILADENGEKPSFEEFMSPSSFRHHEDNEKSKIVSLMHSIFDKS